MYLEPNEKAKGNLRARIRTNILYYYANAKNYLVLGSSDKSEYMIGYFTKFGDGASDITSNNFAIQATSKRNCKIFRSSRKCYF